LQAMADGLAEHIDPKARSFVEVVFSLHQTDRFRELLGHAGLGEVRVEAKLRTLRLPPPASFLWQYIDSTPLAPLVAKATDSQRAALERDVCRAWEAFSDDDGMTLEVSITTASAVRC